MAIETIGVLGAGQMGIGIAQVCLAEPRVARVTVCVDKPAALRFARSVAVEITRDRDSRV